MNMKWMEKMEVLEQVKKEYLEKIDPVVEANRALLHQRSQVGIAKYGVTLDGARLSERELIVHALQEALDLANYLQAQLQRVDREAGNGK